MNRKDRFYQFFLICLDALRFHGFFYFIKFLFHALRSRLIMSKKTSGVYKFYGYNLYYANGGSVFNTILELFGENIYYFHTDKKNPVIVDLGANIGDTVTYFKWLYPDSTIFAFEPNPGAFKLLEKNISENKFSNLHVYNQAVGLNEGEIELYDDNSGVFNLSTTKKTLSEKIGASHSNSVKVPLKKVSNNPLVIEQKEIDLVKIDIEGAENDVMLDIQPLLSKIKHIIIEFHMLPDSQNNSFDSILGILNGNGFKVNISGFYRNVNNYGNDGVFLIYAHRIN